MRNNFEKENKRLIKELEGLRDLRASDELKDRVMLTARHSQKVKPRTFGLVFPKAAVISAVLLLFSGAGIIASEKVRPGIVSEPIKDAASSIKASIEQKRSTPQKESPQPVEEGQPEDDKEESTPTVSQDPVGDSEKTENEPTETPTPTLTPTGQPEEALNEVKDSLPEPAQGVVEGVTDALENTPDNNNVPEDPQNEGEENRSEDNSGHNVPEDSGSQNSKNGIDVDLDLPL